MAPPTLRLPAALASRLEAGHPWVYREHVPHGFRAPAGSIVRIEAGGFTAHGFWDPSSAIAVRVTSREPPSKEWVRQRVREAWELREPLRRRGLSSYRWLFGEGDGLPAVTVDLYDRYAVVVGYAPGLDVVFGWVADALASHIELDGVLLRRRGGAREEGEPVQVLRGAAPDGELVIAEGSARLIVDLLAGQKTGLFLDHRENRFTLAELAAQQRVLNLFAYTGAFSVHAGVAGAASVTSVDVAAAAVDTADRAWALNGLDPGQHEGVVADVFEYLEKARGAGRRWDIVISDPPSFAKNREQVRPALKAYRRLVSAGLRATELGGWYAAGSCTAQVSPEAFRSVIAEAAARARRRFQIVHEAGQPLDHPVMAHHPEGRYLKFVLGRVLAK